jgi:lisH domain-containing protein FOPNL
MAKSVNELKDVLKETLEENGVLSQIRAKIRAEIFNTLNDNPVNKPELSNENLLINELIREYLTFNNYSHTLAVFLPESGHPHSAPFDRSYITKKLKLVEDKNSRELPLLYGSNITILGLTFGAKKLVNQD